MGSWGTETNIKKLCFDSHLKITEEKSSGNDVECTWIQLKLNMEGQMSSLFDLKLMELFCLVPMS